MQDRPCDSAPLAGRPWPRAPEHYKHFDRGSIWVKLCSACGTRFQRTMAPGRCEQCLCLLSAASRRLPKKSPCVSQTVKNPRLASRRLQAPGCPSPPYNAMGPSRGACETHGSCARRAHCVSDRPRLRPAPRAPHTSGPGPESAASASDGQRACSQTTHLGCLSRFWLAGHDAGIKAC